MACAFGAVEYFYDQPCNTVPQKHSLDAFIFSCFTGGLRHIDLSRLEWKDIKENYLIIQQQKTGDEVKVYLHPVSKKILDTYRIEDIN